MWYDENIQTKQKTGINSNSSKGPWWSQTEGKTRYWFNEQQFVLVYLHGIYHYFWEFHQCNIGNLLQFFCLDKLNSLWLYSSILASIFQAWLSYLFSQLNCKHVRESCSYIQQGVNHLFKFIFNRCCSASYWTVEYWIQKLPCDLKKINVDTKNFIWNFTSVGNKMDICILMFSYIFRKFLIELDTH